MDNAVVIGVFEDPEAVVQVMTRLSTAPLEIREVALLCTDAHQQRRMLSQAGIAPGRAVQTSGSVGLLLGAILGTLGGAGHLSLLPAAEAIGPIMGGLAGALIGAAALGGLASVRHQVRLPREHAEMYAAAVKAGKLALIVQTDSLPAARAVRDLFARSGALSVDPNQLQLRPVAPAAAQ
jgi:hypothetical protein